MGNMEQAPSRGDIPAWYSKLGQNADPELYRELTQAVEPAALRDWFFRPNEAFGGRSPAKLIEAGEIEPLRRAAYYLSSGQPG